MASVAKRSLRVCVSNQSMTDPDVTAVPPSRAVHWLAILAVCLVWPLIWVGGLVTTYDAGMAVPDWPNTYGYNLFLYPYTTWLAGPFDLLIEHGHRLLGALVGLVAIAIVVAAYVWEPRRWVFYLALLLLAAVISQGLLGGIRVRLNDRTVAMIHGCVGPICFALCVVVAVVTSRVWDRRGTSESSKHASIGRTGVLLVSSLVLLSYGQLVLGAQLRHVQPTASTAHFTGVVALHVMTAFLLWLLTIPTWISMRRCGDLTLSRSGLLLIGLVAVQIALGVGTWVVNYGWPTFLQFIPGSTGFLVRAKGFIDSIIVTSHVATGSLILAVATLMMCLVLRVRHRSQSAEENSARRDPEMISSSTAAKAVTT